MVRFFGHTDNGTNSCWCRIVVCLDCGRGSDVLVIREQLSLVSDVMSGRISVIKKVNVQSAARERQS